MTNRSTPSAPGFHESSFQPAFSGLVFAFNLHSLRHRHVHQNSLTPYQIGSNSEQALIESINVSPPSRHGFRTRALIIWWIFAHRLVAPYFRSGNIYGP